MNNDNKENIENRIESEKYSKDKKQKGRYIFAFFIAVFICIISGLGISYFVIEDKQYSETENRVLSSFPTLSLGTVTEGTFMKKFEEYLTDQFVFRDEFTSLKTFIDRLSGKTEINGVYIGKQGYLFSKTASYDDKIISDITNAISDFSEKYADIKKGIMIAPDSGFIYSELLPDSAVYPEQNHQLSDIKDYISSDKITWIDLVDSFQSCAKETQLYYKTDHHWTTRGAYEAFKVLADEWKLGIKKFKYEFYPVSSDFKGTLSSKTGINSSSDIVEICVPAQDGESFVVSYDSQRKKTATFFDESKLNTKNQYEVFFGGNFDKITITTVSQSKRTLLLIKDSYANCFIPMLTPYFNKIVVVDPRYLTDSLEAIMEENSFSHVLFLYNLNTLLEDTSLAQCLAG